MNYRQNCILIGILCFTITAFGAAVNILFEDISGTKRYNENHRNNEFIAGIAGGTNSSITKHNYIAAIYTQKGFVGSAIILNKKFLVTAAWNVYWESADYFKVRVGSSYANKGGKTIDVKKYILYPNYDLQWIYDVAILKLSKPLKFSKAVHSISLATSLPENDTETVVCGWGWDQYSEAGTQILKEAKLPFLDFPSCKPRYKDVSGFTNYSICTAKKGVGPCAKDFGSPLVYNNKLIGVYSGAFECGGVQRPGVYADVTKYRKWILKTIKKETDNNEDSDINEEDEIEEENNVE